MSAARDMGWGMDCFVMPSCARCPRTQPWSPVKIYPVATDRCFGHAALEGAVAHAPARIR